MKAKEYFEKYRELIADPFYVDDETGNSGITLLFIDMSSEFRTICHMRNVKTDSGAVSILKELNQKWNAINALFKKEYGYEPLAEDGFKKGWIKQMPVLADHM
jgi:hypothetical protein